jgi:hypothetical protein
MPGYQQRKIMGLGCELHTSLIDKAPVSLCAQLSFQGLGTGGIVIIMVIIPPVSYLRIGAYLSVSP